MTRNYAGGTLNIDKLPGTRKAEDGSANSASSDAAAAATALATGSGTNNGLLSMLPNGEKLQSVAQVMKNKGGKVGIVTTGLVTNPVCAAFYANSLNSTDEAALAEQALRSKIDLLVGGGGAAFRACVVLAEQAG